MLFLVIVGFITITGLSKPLFFPNFFEKKFKIQEKHSDFIIGFLTLTGAFLSITIGLIIVGAYENYGDCETTVVNEVSALQELKRTVIDLEKFDKEEVNKNLKIYSDYVIQKEWPMQQKGMVPSLAVASLDGIGNTFLQLEPIKEKDKILYAHAVDVFADVVKYRQQRIYSIQDGLPLSIYIILMLGLLINILVSWQIVASNKRLEIFIYTLTGILAGSLVFIIVAMDNPYRGAFSVTADAFKLLQ